MKVTLSRNDILSHLQRTQNIVERKSTLPILAHILMETQPSALKLCSTDLEVGVTDICSAQVLKTGRTTVHARKFFEIVRELPEAEIQLTQKEENLEIRSGRSLFRLRSLSPDEFPKIPQIQTEETVRLPGRILKEMISRVSISISSDEARYTLTGVLTQMEEKQGVGLFRMVTTDGHRLSYCERTVPDGSRISGFQCLAGKGEKRDVILPRKAVQEMGRLAEEADEKEELEFGVFQENAFVRKDQFSMVMRLVQGKFPDHQAVIPSQIESSLTVSSQRLEEALRRVSLLSTEKTKGVRLSMDANRMVISSNSPEIGEAQEEIDISFQGEPFDVSFNVRYLLDLVQIIHSEISMEFGPGHRPCVLKELSDPQHLYVVMPLRT